MNGMCGIEKALRIVAPLWGLCALMRFPGRRSFLALPWAGLCQAFGLKAYTPLLKQLVQNGGDLVAAHGLHIRRRITALVIHELAGVITQG